jgi:hypothetical protein
MIDAPQSWGTEEEALAALHAYAQQFSEREKDPELYEVFLNGHQLIKLQQEYVLALKPDQQPFTFTQPG